MQRQTVTPAPADASATETYEWTRSLEEVQTTIRSAAMDARRSNLQTVPIFRKMWGWLKTVFNVELMGLPPGHVQIVHLQNLRASAQRLLDEWCTWYKTWDKQLALVPTQ